MRMFAPTCSGVSRNRCARTGAPAIASTVLMPIVRSSVLLPDMFEPLISSTPRFVGDLHVVAHACRARQQRMSDRLSLERRCALDHLGKRIVGMLIAVAGQRDQRLELADRHPAKRARRDRDGAASAPPRAQRARYRATADPASR